MKKKILQLPLSLLLRHQDFAVVHSLSQCDYCGMWVIVVRAAALTGFNTAACREVGVGGWRVGTRASRQVVTWRRVKGSDRYYSAYEAGRCNDPMTCTRALHRCPRLICAKLN